MRAQRRQRLAEARRTLTLIKAIDDSPVPPYKHVKSVEIRERALRRHFSALHSRDVTKITASDVAAVLNTLTPQTAIKSHIAIRKVFDYAATMLEPHDVVVINPADPRRLRAVGWSAKSESESHAAVHWSVMPLVVDELDRMDEIAAACILYIVSSPPWRCAAMTGVKIRESERWKHRWKPPPRALVDDRPIDYRLVYETHLKLIRGNYAGGSEEPRLRALEHAVAFCRDHTGLGFEEAKVLVLAAIKQNATKETP